MGEVFSRRRILSLGTTGLGFAVLGAQPSLMDALQSASPNGTNRDLRTRIDAAFACLSKTQLTELAMDLCNVASPLGHEGAAARFLQARMQEEGLLTHLQTFAPNRTNVLGIHKGSGHGRRLMFNGHLDVTPFRRYFTPFRDWHPTTLMDSGTLPLSQIHGEWISGMGIWNMKGSVAAYVAAVAAVRKARIDLFGDVLIAGVAGGYDQAVVDTRINGENIEGFSAGTKQLMCDGGMADLAIVGEPTSFKLARETFGQVAVRIDVLRERVRPGVQVFRGPVESSAAPEPLAPAPLNAVEYAAEIVQAVRAWVPDYQSRNRVGSAAPQVTISAIEGGIPWAEEPEESSVFVFVHTPPKSSSEIVLEEMRPMLSKLQERYPAMEARASLYSANPGPSIPDDAPIVTALESAHGDVFGAKPEFYVPKWHSAASPLTMHGIPTVTYGLPGEISMEFNQKGDLIRETESVRVEDLVRLARVYIDLIVRLCGDRLP